MSLLTPNARSQVADFLGPGVTLAEIATWADEVRRSRPKTAPWHYETFLGARPLTTPSVTVRVAASSRPSTNRSGYSRTPLSPVPSARKRSAGSGIWPPISTNLSM